MEEETFILNGNFPTWNIDGSSDTRPPEGFSWITWAEHITGKKRGRCSYNDCNNSANVGGHVWVKQIGCCITPICSSCNHHNNSKRWQGSDSVLRSGITVIKTDMSQGMTDVNRRVVVNAKCCKCKKNFIPKQENHRLCDYCFSSACSHKNLIGSW
tara:strand:- start:45 stop:512 length:468 start_codon:yes stop_codon:yes gene_type:complete